MGLQKKFLKLLSSPAGTGDEFIVSEVHGSFPQANASYSVNILSELFSVTGAMCGHMLRDISHKSSSTTPMNFLLTVA